MSLSKGSGLRSMEITHKPLTVLRCKVVVVGDAAVGKTALTQIFLSDGTTFPKNYIMTLGVEYNVKQVAIPDSNFIVELHIFDCAGQAIFNQLDMNSQYFENVNAMVIVFDISNVDSLKSCSKWSSTVRSSLPNTSSQGVDIISSIVANKIDFRDGSEDSRCAVVKEDAIKFATDLGAQYFETSAATNYNVSSVFEDIAYQFFRRFEDAERRMSKV